MKKKKSTVTPEMLKELEISLDTCTLNVNIPSDLEWEKNAIREARLAKYESLD